MIPQKSLEAAVGNWNTLVGQVDSRVVGRARKLKDMGAATGLDDLVELAPFVQVPMLPNTAEMSVAMLPGTSAGALNSAAGAADQSITPSTRVINMYIASVVTAAKKIATVRQTAPNPVS